MNFCIEEIGTRISTSQVESDGNEVKNLLDPNPNNSAQSGFSLRKRGFLTDNFVRPPVTVSIQFPLCVEISHILINPKFGSQTSSAFMIQTETTPYRGVSQKHLVAKEFLNEAIPNCIVFRNPRFQPRPPFSLLVNSTPKPSGINNGEGKEFNLKHPSVHALEKVTGLEVTILRVSGPSVPALGGLEVWGQPCSRCSKDATNKLLVKWMRRTRKSETGSHTSNLKREIEDEEPDSKRTKYSGLPSTPVSVPDEFLDPITQEVMCLPIRLPCGTAVDSATLERYYHEESVWGRPPNNPFTGQAYTDNIKPVADAALKARIDYFLTRNCDSEQLQAVPRTLGRGFSATSTQVSQSVRRTHKFYSSSLFTTVSGENEDNAPNSSSATLCNFGEQVENNAVPEIASSFDTNPISKELSMEGYLKEEMNKLLGKGSLYLAKPPGFDNGDNHCLKCLKVSDGNHSLNSSRLIFYRSDNCSHVLICRTCVLNMDKDATSKCSRCDSTWTAKHLHRVH